LGLLCIIRLLAWGWSDELELVLVYVGAKVKNPAGT
jgi:hypothetical protein